MRRVIQFTSRRFAVASIDSKVVPAGSALAESRTRPGEKSPSMTMRSAPVGVGCSHSLPSRFHSGTSSSQATIPSRGRPDPVRRLSASSNSSRRREGRADR